MSQIELHEQKMNTSFSESGTVSYSARVNDGHCIHTASYSISCFCRFQENISSNEQEIINVSWPIS